MTIPAGVTSIGSSAFFGCTGLTSVMIPAGVTTIGNDAFPCTVVGCYFSVVDDYSLIIKSDDKFVPQERNQQTTIPTGYIGIYTVSDLNNIRNDPGKKYILMNDINLPESETWITINSFSGVLHGNGYAVKDLKSPFVSQNSGVIRELNFINAEVSCINSGGIIAKINSGEISFCTVEGSITMNVEAYYSYSYVGLIAGSSSGTISYCRAEGNVNGYSLRREGYCFAGGIAGNNDNGTIKSCITTGGKVYVRMEEGSIAGAGGIAGQNSGSIYLCASNAIVEASGYYNGICSGGIVGYSNSGNIDTCYFTGSVKASVVTTNYGAFAGGIIGVNGRNGEWSSHGGGVSNCYSNYKSPFGGAGKIYGICDNINRIHNNIENGSGFTVINAVNQELSRFIKHLEIKSGPIQIGLNEEYIILATAYGYDDVLSSDQSGVTWSTSNSSIVQILNTTSDVVSKAIVKGIANGSAIITATHMDGSSVSCMVIVDNGSPVLGIINDNYCMSYGNLGFESDHIGFSAKIYNGPYVFCGMSEGLKENLKAKDTTVTIQLPTGFSFQKDSLVNCFIYNYGDFPADGYLTVDKEIYRHALPPNEAEKEIMITVTASNAEMVIAKSTINISENPYYLITDLNKESLTCTDKPKMINNNYELNEALIINSSVGSLTISGNLTVHGAIIVEDGGSLYINGSVNCSSLSVNGGVVWVIDRLLCTGTIDVLGGSIIMYGNLSSGNIEVKNGELAVNSGQLTAGSLKLSYSSGLFSRWSGTGGVLNQSGGEIIVSGDFISQTNGISSLAGGELWIGGNFEQGNDNDNFQAGVNHRTFLYGSPTIKFDWGAKGKSNFGNLYVCSELSSDTIEYVKDFVSSEFCQVTVCLNNYTYRIMKDLNPQSSWERNVLELSQQSVAINLAGFSNLYDNFDNQTLNQMGKAVTWWLSVISSPVINAEFDEVNNTDENITFKVENKAGKIIEVTFYAEGITTGMWGSLSFLSVSVDGGTKLSCGIYAGADVNNFKTQAAGYLAESACDKVLCLYKGSVYGTLSAVGYEKVVKTLVNLESWIGAHNTAVGYAGLCGKSSQQSIGICSYLDPVDIMSGKAAVKMISDSFPLEADLTTATPISYSATVQASPNNDFVDFVDSKLEAAIRSDIGLDSSIAFTDTIIQGIKRLDLRNKQITDLTGIENFVNLEVLYLGDNYISDLSPLANLPLLKTLDISRNTVRDITALSTLNNLQYLNASGNVISDISQVGTIISLLYLDISNNRVASLSAVNTLTVLEHLNISNNTIQTLGNLTTLTALKVLYAENCALTDITGLYTENIKTIDVSGNLIQIIPITSLLNLETADFSNNRLTTIVALKDSAKLTELYVENNKLTDNGVNGSFSLTSLKIMDISNNEITDINFLSSSTGIEYLNASGNEIQSLIPINSKIKLMELKLAACGLTDNLTAPISSLTALKVLDVSNNELTSIAFVNTLSVLVFLDISGNSIGDTQENIQTAEFLNNLGTSVTTTDETVHVSSVIMLDETLSLHVGKETALGYFIFPYAATNKDVTWSSNDETVVYVDENGYAVPVSAGTATITVTTFDGSKTASCSLIVNDGFIMGKTSSGCIVNDKTNCIYGLEPGLTKALFESSYVLVNSGYSLEYSADTIGTGTLVSVRDNNTDEVVDSYIIVIYGDVNGDGVIDTSDADMIVDIGNYALPQWDPVTDAAYIKACDLFRDGVIDENDCVVLKDVQNYALTLDQRTGVAQ